MVGVVLTVAISAISVGANVAEATSGVFLNVPGIPGEATFVRAAGQIDCVGFQWQTGQAKPSKYGNAGVCTPGPNRLTLGELCVQKRMDKASPDLFLAAALGTDLKEVTITFWRLDPNVVAPSATYVLWGPIISSINVSSASANDPVPLENVCFTFDKFQETTTYQRPDGQTISTSVGFDMCTGDPLKF